MNENRYIFKCEVVDTHSDEVVASGEVVVPNQVRGDYNAVFPVEEWQEESAESTFWDTMRNFRRAQVNIEADENAAEEPETL